MGRHNGYKKRKRNNNQSVLAFICSILFIAIIVVVVLIANNINDSDNMKDVSSSDVTSSASSEQIKSQPIESSKPVSSEETSELNSSVESSDPVSSEQTSSKEEIVSSTSSDTSSKVESSKPQTNTSSTKPVAKKLNPNFSNLLLVNGENPLPSNYNPSKDLMIIEDKYLCGWRNQLHKDVMPYVTAMIEAAWADGVDLYILSPYRSVDTQKTLYENEVQKWIKTGMDRTSAEDKAATVVARPGTSEHHTGLAIDFNSVEPSFENTPMYKWLDKNAHNYGFILRYTKEKQPITGVIHEAWHWRFIGINAAKKYKSCGNICFEEFVEKYGNEF